MGILDLFTELRNNLRFPDDAIQDLATAPTSNGPISSEPKRLIEAVYFSRSFVPTYYLVLALVVLVASISHFNGRWAERKQSHRPRRTEKSSTPSSSSASSTVFEGDQTESQDGIPTERTSLLEHDRLPHTGPAFATRVSARVRSFFTYQPKPIPALTAPFNQLPSNAVSFLVIVLFFVNLFYLLYGIRWSLAMMFAFAHRAGLCFVANLPVLYVLGAKNNQPLKWLTGWSYEKVNLFHRRLGEWMIILGVLHCIGMFITWYTLIRPQGPFTLGWFLSERIIILGNTALASFLVIWFTSTGQFRAKAYELFLAIHVLLQIAALVLLFFHHSQGRPYIGAALGVWILDRGISRILCSNTKFIATLEIAKDETTVLLYCDIKLDPSKRGDIRSGWKAGQHVFLSVPAIFWYHAFQAHPFTIASPAPPACVKDAVWPMQLIIRCMDGFSKDLLEYAKFHQHVEITLDGPYGSSDLEDTVISAERVCLIAGGSGITVTYPLAWSLWTKGKEHPMVSNRTVYENGRKKKTEVLLRSSPSEQHTSHFWIRQNSVHGNWITMFPIDHDQALISSEASHSSSVVDLVSRRFDTRQDGYAARPDIATELRMWLENTKSILDRDQKVCVVVSGPESLVRDVRNCVAKMIRAGYSINLHVEKFGW